MTPTLDDVVSGSARLPARVIVPAVKLPEPSRRTMALGVLVETAFETTVAPCVPVTWPARLPEKFVVLVAVVALPLRAPVIVPAEKLPPASRLTIALAVLAFVAAFASAAPPATFAAVCPPTVATDGLGYVPLRSPPAAAPAIDP